MYKAQSNRREQEKAVNDEITRISTISDRGERAGAYYNFYGILERQRSQFGGKYQGVSSECYEGMKALNRLMDAF